VATACAAALFALASSVEAGPYFGRTTVGVGVGVTFPVPAYGYAYGPPSDYRPLPSAYGYPLDDYAGGYYGGSRYRDYYSFGRGVGFADFPGPIPGNLDRPIWDLRNSYVPWHPPVPPAAVVVPPPPVVVAPASRAVAAVNQPAYLLVHVPPAAEVRLDDQPTRQAGADRLFMTPPLTPNVVHLYEVTARWPEGGRMVEQRRQVSVKAGERSEVSFANGN